MTQDDVIRLAREAGFRVADQFAAAGSEQDMIAFAKLVAENAAANEREACAKIADSAQDDITFIGTMAVTVATAIRERGQA